MEFATLMSIIGGNARLVCHGQQSIASRFASMTLRSTCLAVATIDTETMESHLTSGCAPSKGAIAGSIKWKTLVSIFVVFGNCVSRSLPSTDAKISHKVVRTRPACNVSFKLKVVK